MDLLSGGTAKGFGFLPNRSDPQKNVVDRVELYYCADMVPTDPSVLPGCSVSSGLRVAVTRWRFVAPAHAPMFPGKRRILLLHEVVPKDTTEDK